MAENTGRSGSRCRRSAGGPEVDAQHPRHLNSARLNIGEPRIERRRLAAIAVAERPQAFADHVRRVFAGHRQHVFAVQFRVEIGFAQDLTDGLLEVIGRTFLDHQHGPLACAKAGDLLGHQRMHHVEHQRRQLDSSISVAQSGQRHPAVQHVEQSALHDDADLAVGGAHPLVQLVLDDELPRGGKAAVHLVGFLAEGGRRVA
jgi:hypothetical protein